MNAAAPALTVSALSHGFGAIDAGLGVLHELNFSVRNGEFVCLVGPSGCGKTTILRILAGLIRPSRGSVAVAASPGERAIGVVFQNDRLLPWRTVHDNVRLALEGDERDRERRDERVTEVLELVRLSAFARYHPHELSGGMRQRVNLARALVARPAVLLMDEPFASLDALTREQMQVELMRLSSELATSVVLVTHQIDEAIYLGDRVVVLSARPARIVADVGVPFARPRSGEIKVDDAFFALEREIWKLLHGGAA